MKAVPGALCFMLTLGLTALAPLNRTTVDGQSESTAVALKRAAQQPLKPINATRARLENEANTIAIVKRFEPGLVFITTSTNTANDPFSQYYGPAQRTPQQGLGSGFFVNENGDILTNYHVIGEADRIQVKLLASEQTYEATVIGKAPQYDLALIRARDLPRHLVRPIPLGDSNTIEVGQKAIALGAPFGFDFSVTEGIVSSTNRRIPIGFGGSAGKGITQRALQTDAAINPGNSGGPLLDSTGRVIGINTQIISPSGSATGVGQSAGVGFAIPVNVARALLPRLRQAKGGIVLAPRIGVTPGIIVRNPYTGEPYIPTLRELNPYFRAQHNLPGSGLLVGSVDPGSPAAEAGLRGGNRILGGQGDRIIIGGDVIVKLNGKPVDALDDLESALIDKNLGERVQVTVRRGRATREITLRLNEYSFQTAPQ